MYLLLVYPLHPPAEPATGKDKHRHPKGSQHQGTEGQKSSATPFTKYLPSMGFGNQHYKERETTFKNKI